MKMKSKPNGIGNIAGHSRTGFMFSLFAGLLAGASSLPAMSGVAIDSKPVTVANAVPGNMVLTPSVEWPTVVTHANEPGSGGTYTTGTSYAGYFHAGLCYAYHFDVKEVNRYFYPVRTASGQSCNGLTGGEFNQRLWSGNFLNWASMQAIDTFRMALTGGYRVHRPADGTPPSVSIIGANGNTVSMTTSEMPNITYLEKGNSDRENGSYTPQRQLTTNAAVTGATPVQTSNDRGIRVRIGGLRSQMWLYPSKSGSLGSSQLERPVTDSSQSAGVSAIPYNPEFNTFPDSSTSTTSNTTACKTGEFGCTGPNNSRYTHTTYGNDQAYAVSIRVQVCDGSLDVRDFCHRYSGSYKPEGLLQENAKKTRFSLFAYLTQSGGVRPGGVMRARQKLIGPVTPEEQSGAFKPYPDRTGRIAGIDNPEWDPVTGVFVDNPDAADAAATNLGSCNDAPDGSNCQIRYSGVINYLNRFGQIETGNPSLKSEDNVGEMYYTMLRYLRGIGNVSAYSNMTDTPLKNYQNADGLPVITDWYKNGSATLKWGTNSATGSDADPMLYQCQATVTLGIGDTGSHQDTRAPASDDTALGSYSSFMAAWLNNTNNEGDNTSRNLISALAYWAHVMDIRPDIPNQLISTNPERRKGQSISTYWVDVVELKDLKSKKTNQYYLATKYGGYKIPDEDYNASGNATKPTVNWLDTNRSTWSNATQLAKAATGLGGTGDFYLPRNMFLANDGNNMIKSLKEAFVKIVDDISGSGGSFASNSTRLESGAYTYQAKYSSSGWSGQLTASSVNTTTGALTEQWDAATWLNGSPTTAEYSKRKILYWNGSELKNFISNWNNYNVVSSPTISQPTALSSLTTAQVKYLLGDRSGERQYGGSFRNRNSMLGDIINSQPIYVGAPNATLYPNDASYKTFVQAQSGSRTPIVYVGGNDGMLHAFDASTGTNKGREVFAFMPTAAMAVLKQNDPSNNKHPIWDPEYDHAYSMDGELSVADVKVSGSWKTVLVGTMGRGGKSVFALDITDPTAPKLLWEIESNADIGNVLGKPIIAETTSGWKVFFGNGPNSANTGSKLISVNIATGTGLTSISAGAGADNGLGPVNIWDENKDGVYDTAYAGDMKGDMYKFNLVTGTASKLFATSTSGQSITVQPLVARNPYSSSETWVFFGTGRYLSLTDTTATANSTIQTWYGLIDTGSTISGKGQLEQVKILSEDSIGRVIEENPALDVGKRGWYIDLAVGGAAKGERMVVPNFFQGLTLIGTTRYPESGDPCAPSGKGYTMAINPFTGSRLDSSFFDNDGSGKVGDVGDSSNGVPYSGITYNSGPNNPIFIGDIMYTSMDDGTSKVTKTSSSMGTVRRVSWRELLNGS